MDFLKPAKGEKMKNKKIKYLLYLICLHSICIFFTVIRFIFPTFGEWIINTRFLNYSFSVYHAMIIFIFPSISIIPYFFQYDFPHVSWKKKLVLATILIGNTILILTYTAFIYKIIS